VPPIVLHECRHTALSLMEKAGVPISIVSKWAGHYDTAFTYSTYVPPTTRTCAPAPMHWADLQDQIGKTGSIAVQAFVINCETMGRTAGP
jgi:hypothetical protein